MNMEVDFAGETKYITSLRGLQGNAGFYDKVRLPIAAGEMFGEASFKYDPECVPVIMGGAFREYYAVGDELDFNYLTKSWHGKIVGFLEKGVSLDVGYARFDSLDAYVLTPFVDMTEADASAEPDSNFALIGRDEFIRMYWLFRDNALFYIDNYKDYDAVNEKVERLAAEYDVNFQLLRGY